MSTSTIVITDKRFLEHDPGRGHPESPARLDAVLDRSGARTDRGRDHRGAAVRDRRRDRGRPPRGLPRGAGIAGRAAQPAGSRHRDVAGKLGRRAAGGGRRGRGGARDDERARAERVRARASARAPRRARPRDGVLPAQQRGDRGRGGAAGRRGARADRRLGRPPRQRHAGHLRGTGRRDVHVGAPVSRSIRARARPTRSASAPAAARPSTAAARRARATRTTASCSTICSCPWRGRSIPSW